MDWTPAEVWDTLRTAETCSGGEAAAGGCSWWGHIGPALHPLKQRPRTAQGSGTQHQNPWCYLNGPLNLLIKSHFVPHHKKRFSLLSLLGVAAECFIQNHEKLKASRLRHWYILSGYIWFPPLFFLLYPRGTDKQHSGECSRETIVGPIKSIILPIIKYIIIQYINGDHCLAVQP